MLHPARLSHVFQWRPGEEKSGTEERVEQSACLGECSACHSPPEIRRPCSPGFRDMLRWQGCQDCSSGIGLAVRYLEGSGWGAHCGFSTSVPAVQLSVSLTDVPGVLNSYCADQWSEGLWVRHLISGSPYPEGNVERVAKCSSNSAVFAYWPGTRGCSRRRLASLSAALTLSSSLVGVWTLAGWPHRTPHCSYVNLCGGFV